MFVTLEGIDGAGKTSVTERLRDEYEDSVITTEPDDDSWVGQCVRRAIGNNHAVEELPIFEADINNSRNPETPELTDFFLFLADHYKHLSDVVLPALRDGKFVVSDRYLHSRYAYQSVVLDDIVEREDTLGWIQEVQEGPGTLHPDLTLVIDISPEESIRRLGGEGDEKFEKKDFLADVRQNYLELAGQYDYMVLVDGEQPLEKVYEECREHIESLQQSGQAMGVEDVEVY